MKGETKLKRRGVQGVGKVQGLFSRVCREVVKLAELSLRLQSSRVCGL